MKKLTQRYTLLFLGACLTACGTSSGASVLYDSGSNPLDASIADAVSDASDTLSDTALVDAPPADAAPTDVAPTSDLADTKSVDATATDVLSIDATLPDLIAVDVVGTCPADIQPNSACAGVQKCEIGQECCCGKCYPSMVCSCSGGTWACYATDACMMPGCPDASSADIAQPDIASAIPWTLFQLQKGWGPCPPGGVCSESWTLASDGTVTHQKGNTGSGTTMDAADFGAATAILGDASFLALMKNGFVCGMPPTDIGISYTLSLSGVQYTQNVTGCAFSGGQDAAPVQALNPLLTKY